MEIDDQHEKVPRFSQIVESEPSLKLFRSRRSHFSLQVFVFF
jgi:hypothetical protein